MKMCIKLDIKQDRPSNVLKTLHGVGYIEMMKLSRAGNEGNKTMKDSK